VLLVVGAVAGHGFQRLAVVLVGRDKRVRQHLREVTLTSRWTIEDWNLEWTVVIDHGRVEFHRGHVGKAEVLFNWRSEEAFLRHIESGASPRDGFAAECRAASRRIVDLLINSFVATMRAVLTDPVDDAGVRLL